MASAQVLGASVGSPGVAPRRVVFMHALAFVGGFSAVFIVLGASLGIIGFALQENLIWFQRVAGVALIVLGLHLAELITIPLCGDNARQTKWQERYDFDTLIENVLTVIEPDTWDDLGGPGSITTHVTVGHQFLVIAQTDRMHDKIEIYLRRLHQLGGARRPRSVSPSTTLTNPRSFQK